MQASIQRRLPHHNHFQALNLTPYSLIGWSDGGATAMVAAAEYPEHVRSIVAIGVTAYIDEKLARIYRSLSGMHVKAF